MRRSTLQLDVLPGSRKPIYRQIASQIADAIAERALRPGDRLTPYRKLAERHVISPLAVKKAYQLLGLEGLCRRDGKGGFRVAPEAAEWRRQRARGELLRTLLEEELSLEEIELARNVQRRLLPPSEVAGRGFKVTARHRAARFVAGDFYDVLHHGDGSAGAVVADVAGKGIGPSLIMATVKAVLPFLAAGRRVEETLAALNERLVGELGPREFVALAYARFDSSDGRLRLANAGLPDPWLLVPGAPPEELEVPGPRLPLGLRPSLAYQAIEVTLPPGARLLLTTDGLPETLTRAGEPLGYGRLAELLAAAHGDGRGLDEPAGAWLDGLIERIRRAGGRSGARLDDDATVVLVENRSESRGTRANRSESRGTRAKKTESRGTRAGKE